MASIFRRAYRSDLFQNAWNITKGSILKNCRNQCQLKSTQKLEQQFKINASEHTPLTIKLARLKDYSPVLSLLKSSYYIDEPTMKCAGFTKEGNPILNDKTIMMMSEGLSLLALSKNGTILGASINCKTCRWDADQLLKEVKSISCPKTKQLFQFYVFLLRHPDLFKMYNVDELFEISMLTVHPNGRNLGIASLLVAASRELASNLGYRLIRLDATSDFSAHICEKQKMELVYQISYEHYVDENNKQIYVPAPPHTHIRVYVERPGATKTIPPRDILKDTTINVSRD